MTASTSWHASGALTLRPSRLSRFATLLSWKISVARLVEAIVTRLATSSLWSFSFLSIYMFQPQVTGCSIDKNRVNTFSSSPYVQPACAFPRSDQVRKVPIVFARLRSCRCVYNRNQKAYCLQSRMQTMSRINTAISWQYHGNFIGDP